MPQVSDWRLFALFIALITAPVWLKGIGLAPTMTGTAAEAARIGWQDPMTTDHIARDIFERVNEERLTRGLPPLVWDEELAVLAREWSLHMLRDGAYGHSPASFRTTSRFAGTGENILMGQRDAREAHVDWMKSDGHRENILRAEFAAVGIGVVCRNDGSMWATQIFGVPHERARQYPDVDTRPDPIVADGRGPACPATGGPLG